MEKEKEVDNKSEDNALTHRRSSTARQKTLRKTTRKTKQSKTRS